MSLFRVMPVGLTVTIPLRLKVPEIGAAEYGGYNDSV
jgi:hypothetical protein